MSVKKNINKKFGTYIREIRIDQGIGQRELASNVGIAASYLNDIEKGKRAAPKQIIIKKLSSLLKVDINYLNDLAGATKENIAPDITINSEDNPSNKDNSKIVFPGIIKIIMPGPLITSIIMPGPIIA